MMDFGNWGYPKRPKHLERQIGEQFEYNGVKLEVVEWEEDCKGCYFTKNCKKMKFVLSVGTRSKDNYFISGSENYRVCNLDDNGIVMPRGENDFCPNEVGYQQAKPEAEKYQNTGVKFYGISAFGTFGNIKKIVADAGADPEKNYFGLKIDKNRLSERNRVLLFEYDLNYNIWNNIALLQRKR